MSSASKGVTVYKKLEQSTEYNKMGNIKYETDQFTINSCLVTRIRDKNVDFDT
jgi:hypothetical protein